MYSSNFSSLGRAAVPVVAVLYVLITSMSVVVVDAASVDTSASCVPATDIHNRDHLLPTEQAIHRFVWACCDV
jgi:hypothetical protein